MSIQPTRGSSRREETWRTRSSISDRLEKRARSGQDWEPCVRSLFERVGGFDERFARPSVEDIDLGYRMRAAGARILLDPQIQGQHLKHWTFMGSVATDINDRGIPWTQLLHRYGGLHDDLNVTSSYRACVVLAYVLASCLVLAPWRPMLLAIVPLAALSLWRLDRPYYRFFASRRGRGYAVRWFPVHVLHHLCNGLSFAVGTALYACRRWTGITLPGALPVTPWSAREPFSRTIIGRS